ncbi:MAG: carboxymuconolactone decarboxylase family protein [Planctomycetota bacterium]
MRISAKADKDYPLVARLIFWAQRKKYGETLLSSKLWGRSPKVLCGLQVLYRTLDRKGSPIEPSLRTLIGVRVSQINHCNFCMDIGEALLKQRGVPTDKVLALASHDQSPLFSERERAALTYAEIMTTSNNRVDDGLFTRLREHFNDDAIVELTALIAYQNMTSKFNAALDVPSQGFCNLPPSHGALSRVLPKSI